MTNPLAVSVLILAAVVGQPAAQTDAARNVVRAVAARAAELQRSPNSPRGDALTAEYVRTAAKAALAEGETVRATAFLIGLGIALDDSTALRSNPLMSRTVKAAETDVERKARLAVLGQPTLRGRRDLCQHFAVSAALSELIGPAAAESAGLAKEMIDMTRPGGSGFSFADLAADYAGIAFAAKVRKDSKVLEALADGFKVEEYLPKLDGLREGLSADQFRADFGSADDPRFQAAMDEVRKRVDGK